MATATSNFPGRPFRLRMEAWVNWQSGTTANIHVELWIDKLSYSPTWSSNNTSSWETYAQGILTGRWGPGNYDFRNGNNFNLWSQDFNTTVNGAGQIGLSGHASFDLLGYTEVFLTLQATAPTPPPATVTFTPTNITTTSMTVQFSSQGDGGDPITGCQLQYSLHSQFLDGGTIIASNGTSNLTGLTPGSTYYSRSRCYNNIGFGAWSNTVSAMTLPAVPPGMTVEPTPSGTAATVSLTPPGGVSNVNSYNVERRILGQTAVTSANTTTPTLSVTGLTPGTQYQWRANAVIGAYQSPFTDWVTVMQPNPSTSPGDYFDGSTPATPDQTYSWTGAVNNSTSIATGVGVLGWLIFADGSPTGATGTVARITGGLFGSYAARITFTADQTVQGFTGGTGIGNPGRTDVTPNATYTGSIHVNPSRSNRVKARIAWINAAGTLTGSVSDGAEVVVPAGQWTRITVTATAPADAEFAAIWFVTTAGTGSSLWLSGDTVLMDGAMIALGSGFPYFDGSFPDGNGFTYDWVDPALPNASPSIRTDVPVNVADALLDPDCPPVPAPPRPPIVLDDCIEDVGVWRRYFAIIPSTEVSDWLDVLPTFTLTTFTLPERQVRIRIYPNPFNYPLSQIDTTTWCSEQIISYVPPSTVMTLDAELQRVFASVAGGATQAADHLLYGTGGTPANWPILTCGMAYLVSIDTPLEAPAGNTRIDVDLTRRSY